MKHTIHALITAFLLLCMFSSCGKQHKEDLEIQSVNLIYNKFSPNRHIVKDTFWNYKFTGDMLSLLMKSNVLNTSGDTFLILSSNNPQQCFNNYRTLYITNKNSFLARKENIELGFITYDTLYPHIPMQYYISFYSLEDLSEGCNCYAEIIMKYFSWGDLPNGIRAEDAEYRYPDRVSEKRFVLSINRCSNTVSVTDSTMEQIIDRLISENYKSQGDFERFLQLPPPGN